MSEVNFDQFRAPAPPSFDVQPEQAMPLTMVQPQMQRHETALQRVEKTSHRGRNWLGVSVLSAAVLTGVWHTQSDSEAPAKIATSIAQPTESTPTPTPTTTQETDRPRKKSPKPKAEIPAAPAVIIQPDSKELADFEPEAISCRTPAASLNVRSAVDVRFAIKRKTGVEDVLQYRDKRTPRLPHVIIADALDVAVCGTKEMISQAVTVNPKKGTITLKTENLAIRPWFRKSRDNAGVALVPKFPLWSHMQQDPRRLPGHNPRSVAVVNRSLAAFAAPKSPRRERAFETSRVLALRQLDRNPECVSAVHSAVIGRLTFELAKQAVDQGINGAEIHIKTSNFNLAETYVGTRQLQPTQYTSPKGAGYRLENERTKCEAVEVNYERTK